MVIGHVRRLSDDVHTNVGVGLLVGRFFCIRRTPRLKRRTYRLDGAGQEQTEVARYTPSLHSICTRAVT